MSNKLSPDSGLNICKRSFAAALSSFSISDNFSGRCLIAHSGGMDSQLLLHLACCFFPKNSILVVHVNHHLQNDADSWAEFSKSQAQRYAVKHHLLNVSPQGGSENAARNERYQAFEGMMQQGDLMLLGHHADDQAETLLYRMLRGAGLVGMGGMPVSRELGQGVLIRPLLKCTRDEIELATAELSLDYVSDPSNDEDDFDRNYLRNRVIPLLKKRWPKLNQRWSENAILLQEANTLLESYLDADLKRCSPVPEEFDLKEWSEMDGVKKNAILRHWLFCRLGLRINTTALDTIRCDVIQAESDADPQYQLGNVVLRRYRSKLYLVSKPAESLDLLKIEGSGTYNLGDGNLVVTGLPDDMAIQIRRRQGGERCCPLGKSSRPVKKILQDLAILPWHRERWPLAYVDDKLVAVPGVCLCQGSGIEENHEFSILWCPF